jgi:hypothetical protein
MHRPKRVVKPRMQCPRIDEFRQSQLLHPPQPLKKWVLNEVKQQLTRHRNEPVHRVIDNLLLVHATKQQCPADYSTRHWMVYQTRRGLVAGVLLDVWIGSQL